jgi:hypothetical protein
MPTEKESFTVFFKCLGISMVITSLRISIIGMSWYDLTKTVTLTYLYNFITNIPTALAVMFGVDFYNYLKKNIKNEFRKNNRGYYSYNY